RHHRDHHHTEQNRRDPTKRMSHQSLLSGVLRCPQALGLRAWRSLLLRRSAPSHSTSSPGPQYSLGLCAPMVPLPPPRLIHVAAHLARQMLLESQVGWATVPHDPGLSTAYENRGAIFRRVSGETFCKNIRTNLRQEMEQGTLEAIRSVWVRECHPL